MLCLVFGDFQNFGEVAVATHARLKFRDLIWMKTPVFYVVFHVFWHADSNGTRAGAGIRAVFTIREIENNLAIKSYKVRKPGTYHNDSGGDLHLPNTL